MFAFSTLEATMDLMSAPNDVLELVSLDLLTYYFAIFLSLYRYIYINSKK